VIAVLIVVVIGVIALLPGLFGVRSAISDASPGWVLAGAGIQLLESWVRWCSCSSCSPTSRTT
jgi:hypothetical protein